ncbi:MAG TPA: nitroreductase family protein [Anaerolineales bacterium]|nr:nitroreductase family protein [Anaerolineales bacterium]
MDTLEAIFSRRSIRAFTAESVSDEALQTIIQAAAAAPSGSNLEKRIFLSIQKPRRIAALRALAPGIIGRPAAVIVICLDQRSDPGEKQAGIDLSQFMNIGAALQNLLLAAHASGLGACPVASFHAQGLGIFLGLPEGIVPCLLVVLGKPRFTPSAPRKRPLDEIYYRETFEISHG